MRKDIVILVAEDEPGHFVLIRNCLLDAGIDNDFIQLSDGQETLDYLMSENFKKQKTHRSGFSAGGFILAC